MYEFIHAIPGDSNFDGVTSLLDLATLSGNWRGTADWCGGDVNRDYHVDLNDLADFSGYWEYEREGGMWSVPTGAAAAWWQQRAMAASSLASLVGDLGWVVEDEAEAIAIESIL